MNRKKISPLVVRDQMVDASETVNDMSLMEKFKLTLYLIKFNIKTFVDDFFSYVLVSKSLTPRMSDLRDSKMVIIVRTDLNMKKGKIASQCAHAAVDAYTKAAKLNIPCLRIWLAEGQKKVVLCGSSESELRNLQMLAIDSKLVTALITDAGRTQIEAGTVTTLAIGPGPESKINEITGHLKLL